VITIDTDEELDLKSHGVFVDACRLARYPDQTHIDVNLRKTRNIRGSGIAMLLTARAYGLGTQSHPARQLQP
jgi:hypothetical protein